MADFYFSGTKQPGTTKKQRQKAQRSNDYEFDSKVEADPNWNPFKLGQQSSATKDTAKVVPKPAPKPSLFSRAKTIANDFVVKPTIETAEKTANTVGAGIVGAEGLRKGSIQTIMGNKKGANKTFAEANKKASELLDSGAGGKGGYATSKQAHSTGGGTKSYINDFVKPVSQASADIAPYVVPGVKAAKGAKLVERAAVSGATQSGVATGTGITNDAIQGRLHRGGGAQYAKNAVIGFVAGAAAPVLHEGVKAGKEAVKPKVNASINPEHIVQGLMEPEIKKLPASNLTLGAEVAGKKVDNAKVAQYVKQIKDGEPIEPVVVHHVDGKPIVVDGQHRLAAMQKLGITDIPTVEKIPGAVPEPKTVSVAPTKPIPGLSKVETPAQPMLPSIDNVKPVSVSSGATIAPKETVVPSEPVMKTSGSALNLEAKAVQKGLTKEFEGKAQYNTGSFKDEAAKAVDLVENDPKKAMDIASGKLPGDNTIHEVAIARALENKALKEGDTDTLLKLAQSPRHAVTSEAAQRLGAEGFGEKNSVVKSLAAIRKIRQDSYESRTGKKLNQTVDKELNQIRAAKPKVRAQDWNQLIDELKC